MKKCIKKISCVFISCILLGGIVGCSQAKKFDKDKAVNVVSDFVNKTYSYEQNENLISNNNGLKDMCTDSIYKNRLDLSNNDVFNGYYGRDTSTLPRTCTVEEVSVKTETSVDMSFILVIKSAASVQTSSNTTKETATYFPLQITINKDYKVSNITEYTHGLKVIS